MYSKRIVYLFFIIVGMTLTGVSQTISIPITVSDGNNDFTLTIGMHEYGTDGLDEGLDMSLFPTPMAGIFDARLRWGTEDYAKDVRDNLPTEKVFEILYQVAEDHGPIQLSWDPAYLSEIGSFEIVDRITGELWGPLDMAGNNTLDVSAANGILDDGLHIRMTHSIPPPDVKTVRMIDVGAGISVEFEDMNLTFNADVIQGGEVTAAFWENRIPVGGAVPLYVELINPFYFDLSTRELQFENGVVRIPVSDLPPGIDVSQFVWMKRGYMVADWEEIGGEIIDDYFVSTIPFDSLSEFAIGMKASGTIFKDTEDIIVLWTDTGDTNYTTNNVMFVDQATGTEFNGRKEVAEFMQRFWNEYFDVDMDAVRQSMRYTIGDRIAVVEFILKGTHTGEINGIPPSNNEVEFPVYITYELEYEPPYYIRNARIYTMLNVLIDQIIR